LAELLISVKLKPNKLKNLILFFLFFSATVIFAQPITKYSTTNKKAISQYENAINSFQEGKIAEAKKDLQKAVQNDPKFAEAYSFLAELESDEKNYEKALEYYDISIKNNPNISYRRYLFAAQVALIIGDYAKAKSFIDPFLKFPGQKPIDIERAKQIADNANFGLEAIKNPVPFNPKNVGASINSEFNEYFPAITADGETFIVTRELRGEQFYGGANEDFYISSLKNNQWQTAKNLGKPINSAFNEGAPTISPDGQSFIFTACQMGPSFGPDRIGAGSCDLFFARKVGNSWEKPINLGPEINTSNWETQPSLSIDGKTLYFIRGSRDNRNRRSDIYTSILLENGKWSLPKPLSNVVNTPGNEQSLFIHPDGKTLYFASDGHPGMGGLDIFMTQMQDNGEWTKPVNLGYPINTKDEESGLIVGPDGKTAYFSSNREGGFGGLDVYSFELPENVRANPISFFKGQILDKETNKPLEAKFQLIDLEINKIIAESFSNKGNGEFLISLPIGKNYALNASAKGYLFYSENISLKDLKSTDKPFIKNVLMSPIKEGEKMILENVFFNTASFDLKNESKAELDKLFIFLKENENLSIEIMGHTDNVGDKKMNQILSENRCKSVITYLANKGIENNRLTFKGLGDAEPIADNNSEEGRAKNRRTEFKVVKK